MRSSWSRHHRRKISVSAVLEHTRGRKLLAPCCFLCGKDLAAQTDLNAVNARLVHDRRRCERARCVPVCE